MKTTLGILTLLFSLSCHAQSERWQLSIPVTSSTFIVPSAVTADGVGGGAIVIKADATRVAWFNSSGGLIYTNDFRPVSGMDGNLESPGRVNVLRVTPKVLDFAIVSHPLPFGHQTVTLQRVSSKVGEANARPLLETDGNAGNERVASGATTGPDKRGFFTTQITPTNVIVRRYSF